MGSSGNPVFNEVLQVSIDVDQFVNGLKQLEDAYDAFVERVNAKGFGASNVLGVGAFASVSETLNQLSENFTSFDAALTQSADNLESIFSKAAQGIEAMSQRIVDSEANVAKGAAEAKAAVEGLGAAPVSGAASGGVNPELFQQSATAAAQLNENLKPVVPALDAAKTFASQFSANLTLSGPALGAMAGQLLTVNLLWGAINKAVEIFIGLVKLPFEAIANGVTYLTQLQEKAADLQGPILAAVKFSDDLGENFKIAGQQAENIAKQFEDFAAKTGIQVTVLDNAFKSFLDSGGAALTGGLSGAVDSVEKFALAMKAAGVSTEGTRRIISEIPKLLEGTPAQASKILQVLGLTADQWKSMRAEAEKYGNLQDLLAEHLKPFLSVLEQAQSRLSVLKNELELVASRTEAIAAKPIFDALVASLQKLLTLYEDNRNGIEQLANIVGVLTTKVLHLGSAFLDLFSAMAGGQAQTKDFIYFFAQLAETGGLVVNTLTAISRGIGNIFAFAHAQNDIDIQIAKDELAAIGVDFKKQADESTDRLKFLKSGYRDLFVTTNPGTGNGDPTHGPRDLDAGKEALKELHELRTEYNTAIDETKKKTQESTDQLKVEASLGAVSHHQAFLSTVADLTAEISKVEELTKTYTDLAKASGAKSGDVDKVVGQLNKTQTDTVAAIQHQIAAATEADNKFQEALTLQHFQAEQKLTADSLKAELQIQKDYEAQGRSSKLATFDAEYQIEVNAYNQRKALLDKEASIPHDDKEATRIYDAYKLNEQQFTEYLARQLELRAALVHAEQQRENQEYVQEQQKRLNLQKTLNGVTFRGRPADDPDAQAAAKTDAQKQVNLDKINVLLAAQELNYQQIFGTVQAIEAARQHLLDTETALANATQHKDQVDHSNTDGANVPQFIKDAIDGGADKLKDAFSSFKESVHNMADAVGSLNDVFNSFKNAISSGVKSGGTLGGIGAGLTTAAGFDPDPTGISQSILKIGGGLLSFFGSIFMAEAKKIADQISKQIATTMQDYQNQSINLIQAIGQLQAERADAIAKLSGQKGGQDQLDKLLPQLDQQIAALKLQQTQVLTNFQDQLAVLNEHSQILGQALQTWQNINKQVKDYLGAGGDAAKAAQYLSDNLQQLEASTQASLDSAEATAITDAINLNDLLTQKVQLQKDYNAQLFAARNADAIERSVAPAILIAQTTNAQTLAYNQQLASLNNQIDLATRKVDLEKTVFNIAADTATLQARSNDLAIAALNTQIQQYKDMQKIIASIYQNGSGFYLGGGYSSPGQSAPIIVNIGSISGAGGGTGIGNEIANTLAQRTRYGLTPSFSTR